MKRIFALPVFIALAAFISCNNSGDKKIETTEVTKDSTVQTVTEEKKETSSKELVSATAKPDSIETEEIDFEGIGKIQSFKGGDWKKSGNENYSKALDMTIIMQGQPGDLTEQINDYVDSYIDVNKRDAPKYEVTGKEQGEIKGVKAVRLDGKFDNGTAYVTRDYLFFTKTKVAVLMCRVAKSNENKLNAYIDYMASSYQK